MLRLILIIFSLLTFSCSESTIVNNEKIAKTNSTIYLNNNKLNGASLVSKPEFHSNSDFAELINYNFNWVALSPFGIIRKGDAEIIYNSEYQWKGERPEGIKQAIEYAQQNKLRVMLKPQLWGHGIFTGDIEFSSDSAWQKFESDYSLYILQMAKIAEEKKVELFCIGTELAKFVELRPRFWSTLISDIKQVYTGKLTYAENWDSYTRVPFWSELDYVGVDAYFPLSNSDFPTIIELNTGWKKWKDEMKKLFIKTKKPILFTEWGYRSSISNTKSPWEYGEKKEVSTTNQLNAYKSYFQSIYPQDWYAGGFLWKWFPKHKKGQALDGFTPQHKPSAQFLKDLKTLE